MRKSMIQTDDPQTARDAAPWACAIYRCEGGFWAFEDSRDADRWARELTEDDDATDYSKEPARKVGEA